jgi:hypothetical protein
MKKNKNFYIGEILINLGLITHKELIEARWIQMNKYIVALVSVGILGINSSGSPPHLLAAYSA